MTVGEILEGLGRLNALVVGDVCLDRWCTYDPAFTEPSRETGLSRVAVVRTELTAGAGGTVANNLAALGVGHVSILGLFGNDGHGFELKQALSAIGVDLTLMVNSGKRPTFTYTKLINSRTGEEDQGRVDFVCPDDVPAPLEEELLEHLRSSASDFDVILVSDQAETDSGAVITPAMRALLADIAARDQKRVVWVDSRLRIEHFRGMILKPNEREAREACERIFGPGVYDLGRLRAHVEAPLVITTCGGDRVEIAAPGSPVETIPTRKIENPVDICGAGDSFSAGAATAYALSRDARAAAVFGDLVASVTIMKKGTGTATPHEILAAASRRGIT
ncbi:MAG: PfkB family carbohydrate kinase [Bryobacteraceae bacterium]|nr:PfkB family carbohydrate kinase [Bryobacteraceae bacterium]